MSACAQSPLSSCPGGEAGDSSVPAVRFTTFSPGDAIGEGYCKMSIDTEEGPRREEQTRTEAAAVHAYLASVIPAFKGSSIAGTSLKVLEREGRRVMGEYTLTKEDVLFRQEVFRWHREECLAYRALGQGERDGL